MNAARVSATLAVLAAAGTYVAVQVDLWRRHKPAISVARYWVPQITNIWLPGLGATLALGAVAFWLYKRPR